MPGVVLIFARAPVAGECKTRLIPRYGARGAVRIYRQLLERTLRIAFEAGVGDVELWVAGNLSHPEFLRLRRKWPRLRARRQIGRDLGQRMSGAIDESLAGGRSYALLLGTDAADIEARDLIDAAESLQPGGSDAVLQPSADGGFVMIGSCQRLGHCLRAVRWSSGAELAQTRHRLTRRGLKVAQLRARLDVDHPADWRLVRSRLLRRG